MLSVFSKSTFFYNRTTNVRLPTNKKTDAAGKYNKQHNRIVVVKRRNTGGGKRHYTGKRNLNLQKGPTRNGGTTTITTSAHTIWHGPQPTNVPRSDNVNRFHGTGVG